MDRQWVCASCLRSSLATNSIITELRILLRKAVWLPCTAPICGRAGPVAIKIPHFEAESDRIFPVVLLLLLLYRARQGY